jgi:hypothetical protein
MRIYIFHIFQGYFPLDRAIYTSRCCGVASNTNTIHFSILHYLHALVCIVNSDAPRRADSLAQNVAVPGVDLWRV